MPDLLATFTAALAAVDDVAMDAASFDSLDDASFLRLLALSGTLSRAVSSRAAVVAGEAARRAHLARSLGHRTPEELVRLVTGTTKAEAGRAVRVGRLTSAEPDKPWLACVGAAVRGGLSPACAEAIATGLGSPSPLVPADALARAAAVLCTLDLDPDRLFLRAREARDEIDAAGIGDREAERRRQRSLTLGRRPDGMTRLVWLMDPETAATVTSIYDRTTSPKLGGPRFDTDDYDRIVADTREPEERASDVFAQLLMAGADADSSQLLATGAPCVRVIVGQQAYLEGHHDPVSPATADRLACGGTITEITIGNDGQQLDVGREHRLYTRRQRIALAARDGGCRWPGCERPPSWTEAHHTVPWSHGGKTDVADGVLLCRHHHLLAHNEGWQISRHHGDDYWLVPPPERDPSRQPIAMPSKSRAWRELQSA